MGYDFIGGEHHLRLVLGAHGFWNSRWHCGFSFYSSAWQKYLHIKVYRQDFVGPTPGRYVLVEIRSNEKITVKHLLMSMTHCKGNVHLWRSVTGTRLDLL
jgi:hypothetical protein